MTKLAKCFGALLKNKIVMRSMLCDMRRGFTLIEIVVAIGIFSIASVIISSVYLNANNLHQHTAVFQRLQNDGRYMVEKITREIRAREIKYPNPVESQPQDHLDFLKDEVGEEVSIKLSADGKNLKYSINSVNGVSSANLNADDVEIVDVKFYVIPNRENIWGDDPMTNEQPRVTLFLKLKNKAVNPKFQKEITIQTTISSKVYKR